MISIAEVEKIIPDDALLLFKKIFTPSIYNKILLSLRTARIQTFRVNPLKSDKPAIMKGMINSKFKIKPIGLINGAFEFAGNLNSLLKSAMVTEGDIYLQSLSSMLPPIILDPKHGDKILDIAAAPGSKCTQIAGLISNSGIIDAVEPDYIRSERLKYNIDVLGVNNINVHNTRGEKFYINREKKYDRVLADVPCSGEGRFTVFDKRSYCSWKLKDIKKFAKLQKKLLKSAIMSAKIGGVIVYSTCTLNLNENEEVINDILNDDDFRVEILPVDNKYRVLEESLEPFKKSDDNVFDLQIKKALRIIPSARFEGFFICKMRRLA